MHCTCTLYVSLCSPLRPLTPSDSQHGWYTWTVMAGHTLWKLVCIHTLQQKQCKYVARGKQKTVIFIISVCGLGRPGQTISVVHSNERQRTESLPRHPHQQQQQQQTVAANLYLFTSPSPLSLLTPLSLYSWFPVIIIVFPQPGSERTANTTWRRKKRKKSESRRVPLASSLLCFLCFSFFFSPSFGKALLI